jgi:uncharacterized phage infection (PIP) family protein YhgE
MATTRTRNYSFFITYVKLMNKNMSKKICLKFLIIFNFTCTILNPIFVASAKSPPEPVDVSKQIKDLDKKIDEIQSYSTKLKSDLSKSIEGIDKIQSNLERYDKVFTLPNILLILIELNILMLFGFLWYFGKNQVQKRLNKIEQRQNDTSGKLHELNTINNTVNSFRSTVQETNHQILYLQKSLQELQNSQFKIQESLSKASFNASHSVPSRQIDAISSNSIAVKSNIPQFVAIYNQDKNALADRAIAKVSATEASIESLRNGDSSQIYLEDARSENYWVIEEANINYLIPKKNIKIDSHKLDTVQALFDCSRYYETYSDFQLTKPAKVAKESSGYWRLEERGELSFS